MKGVKSTSKVREMAVLNAPNHNLELQKATWARQVKQDKPIMLCISIALRALYKI